MDITRNLMHWNITRSSEVNIAATDMILLLGKREDVKDDFTYETSKVEGFFVPEGTAIEVYATTLHYAPCGVDGQGFKCVVCYFQRELILM